MLQLLTKSFIMHFSERELMFTFAICHRWSVCRLSVCNVRAPYSEIRYQQLICHASGLSTPGDAQMTEAA